MTTDANIAGVASHFDPANQWTAPAFPTDEVNVENTEEETSEKYCRHAACIAHAVDEALWMGRTLKRADITAAVDAIPSAQVRCRIKPRPTRGAPQAPLP